MILDISPLEAGFFDFIPMGAVGARRLQFTIRFTAYSSYAIELELGRMVLNISPLDRSVSDCSISVRGRAPSNLQTNSQHTIFILLSWNLIG